MRKKGESKENRLRLQDDELEIIHKYRRVKKEAKAMGVNPKDVHSGWIKSKEASLYFQNPDFGNSVDKEKWAKKLVKTLEDHAPSYLTIIREKCKDGHLLVVDPADIHVGKLCTAFETGKNYNQQIAVKQVLDGVDGLLEKSNGFNIDKILLIGGNDILHVDTPKRTTTSGTPQDTDGMWYDNFLMAKQLYVDLIEKLTQVADVHFIFNPSNHDYMSGFFLADTIKTHFRNCENVTFDCGISHRKYYRYHSSLIGTTHGDGAKNNDLGSLMSIEAKQDWAKVDFRYFYTHHVHHKTSKDMINVTIESLRSPSPADSWHDRNGYVNQPAVEAFIHSKELGQVARLTHYFIK
jgi:hypothetical protein